MANAKVKKAMVDADITQKELAQILGKSEAELSYLMNTELASTVQKDMVEKIKAYRR